MRIVLAAAMVVAIAAPAFAQEPSTLQNVTTKGVVMKVQGMEVPVTYTPDGKYTAMGGQVTGTWKINGDKLCTTSVMNPAEACVAYPAGKKSGDEFQVTGSMGPVMIKIN
jgi:hypothetical protein